jgi:hypothetical protein
MLNQLCERHVICYEGKPSRVKKGIDSITIQICERGFIIPHRQDRKGGSQTLL